MKNLALSAIIVSACTLAVLAGCGGSSSSTVTVIPGDLQTSQGTPNYADAEELAAFTAINIFRKKMGLGYWQQSTLLDTAAQNHMAYSILDALVNEDAFQQDIEDANKLGFTGKTPSQRAINTGYFVLINTNTKANVPFAAVGELYGLGPAATVIDSMLNTIYHRSGLMAQSTRVIGIGREKSGANAEDVHWWFSHGRLDAGQYVASDFRAFYPTNQQGNVPLSMTPEYPSVYSDPNFDFAAKTSSPVSFTTAASTILTVKTFTVTPSGSTAPLPGTIWTFANDPNLIASDGSSVSVGDSPTPVPTISNYEAYWVGNTPFAAGVTYNVTFTGSTYMPEYGITTDVTQSWSFTTAN